MSNSIYRHDHEVDWDFGDFNGFSDQKRCRDCGLEIHKDNNGDHECALNPIEILERRIASLEKSISRFELETLPLKKNPTETP